MFGKLPAADVEVLLQLLLAPYLRVPLLLRFFAQPSRTPALACVELRQMLDAALFEPGPWQPDEPRQVPTHIGGDGSRRDHLTTPVGLLFSELVHSPQLTLSSISTMLETSLDLDSGRFVAGGDTSTAVILYVVRLAARIESFARFAVSPKADTVRGLTVRPQNREAVLDVARGLRATLDTHALPVMHTWYARLRRDGQNADACAVAAHLAFVVAGAVAGVVVGQERQLHQLEVFGLVSSRVFLNVHHDFEIEPQLGLRGQKPPKRESKHSKPSEIERLGFEPLDLFDSFASSLGSTLRWLEARPEECSQVLEGVVKLLSGETRTALQGEPWRQLTRHGCKGRFVPERGATAADLAAEEQADDSGLTFEVWLRRNTCAVSKTEVNVQLGDLTLNQNHMQLLDAAICRHADFVAVFGAKAAQARFSCAEVQRCEYRRWLRLLAVDHDVQTWLPDDREEATTGPKLRGHKAKADWLRDAVKRLPKMVPVLAEATDIAVLDEADGFARLCCKCADAPREVVVLQRSASVQVFRLQEHGRRWQRCLEYASDVSLCLAEMPESTRVGASLPAHFEAGELLPLAEPDTSMIITRLTREGEPRARTRDLARQAKRDGPPRAEGERQTFMPTRFLRGLLPDGLLSQCGAVWQRPTGGVVTRLRTVGAQTADGDALHVEIHDAARGLAIIRRVPVEDDGVPRPEAARRLLNALYAPAGSPLATLVEMLGRLENLAHVLLWSACAAEDGAAGEAVGEVRLIELPRLRLSFDVVTKDGTPRLSSREHPGLFVGWLECERAQQLLKGLPHALVLRNAEGESFVLLPALSKPMRLCDESEPLAAQLILGRHVTEWSDAIPGVRHYLYSIHRSGTYLSAPSLAARLYLLLLRWLTRDYATVFRLSSTCGSDTHLSAEEKQLWSVLGDFDDDPEPGAHACRLRLWLATRCCPELPCPWQPAEQLPLYLAKLRFLPPTCHLSAQDELQLLRLLGGDRARAKFLEAAIEAQDADERHSNAARQIRCEYPIPKEVSAPTPPGPPLRPRPTSSLALAPPRPRAPPCSRSPGQGEPRPRPVRTAHASAHSRRPPQRRGRPTSTRRSSTRSCCRARSARGG